MTALLIALLLFGASAVGSLIFAQRGRWPTFLGAGGLILGSLCGIIPATQVALGAPPQSLRIAWDVPYGSLYLHLDALAAFFLVPIFLLCAVAALYGAEYLEEYRGKKALAPSWFFMNVLAASMVVVVLAHNAVLFLMAWETMALSSFFLVTFEDEKESTRRAGWIYLVASHIGAAFLLALFVLLGRHGSLDFDHFDSSAGAGVLFLLALVGFGTKAGFVPLHVWLPEAHPAAPSHVSAVMSAVMIKTGIYGLLRILTFLGPAQAWWGWTLCVVGLTSGVLGVLLALAQHDLKRLLAYSSVENIGIVALGLGVGIVGLSAGAPFVAVAGFAGALLHVLNHALFKGLLFLDAGNVAHATHTREIDHLGGLIRRMPGTGVTFLIGAAAISGLPPLNGFVSEFLIYLAGFKGAAALDASSSSVPMLAAIAGLALIGGLAVACFTKAFGIAFLGHPRTEHAAQAHEVEFAMLAPGFILAAGCVLMGLFGCYVVRSMGPLISNVTHLPPIQVAQALANAAGSVAEVGFLGAMLIGLVVVLSLARAAALARRRVATAVTWDCGYARPASRMQYTASSFAQPLTETFAMLLRTRKVVTAPRGLFPQHAEFHTRTDDPYQRYLFRPVFHAVGRGMASLRPLQQGKVQFYVLYIAITLLALLLWQLA
jgi:formate hydrogenlyase subunit 3/multisubunit Na+/H+ antiporter MnhD subunit